MKRTRYPACPFCAGHAVLDTLNRVDGTPDAYRVQCHDCGAAARWCATEAAAQAAWSIRAVAVKSKAKKEDP
jgi:transcription elongation factor Elf1